MAPRARVVAALCLALAVPPLAAQVPSPKQFLGHDVGEDFKLCNYTDLVRYFRAVEQASDRVHLREIGKTSWGQTMLMAVITSPRNFQQLEQHRSTAKQLCLAEGVDEAAARAMAQSGKAIVWIDAGLHASEAIAGQNIIELVWRMASGDDARTARILDEVILLACPVNPDGLELIANAYRATQSMTIPVLYQRYVGHDNNRDFYICNQLESTNVNRVFYREWFPQIVYNHHQSAPSGTVIFTPPFRDPFNYYADPLVMRGIDIVAAHMNTAFARENKPGAISRSGAPYSGWWNGGLRSTTYFHNIIGILTESFGRPEPTKLAQTLDRRLPYGDYPDPVPTQEWHARQTIEYLQTANFALLDYAARCKEDLLYGIWRMGRNGIERGSHDHWTTTPRTVEAAKRRGDDAVFTDPVLRDPRVYVLRSDQPDFSDAVRLVQALRKNGIAVWRATAPFSCNGTTCPAGSFAIKTAQAFRPHVLDMFEPQWHPDDIKDGKPVPPYDAAGWTLALQFDVQVMRSFEDVSGPFEAVTDLGAFPMREVADAATSWHLDARDGNAVLAVNRLLAGGVAVQWSPQGFFAVPARPGVREQLALLGRELGVHWQANDADTKELRRPVTRPRVGLFDVFGGSMPTGWDLWLLEQHGFDVQKVFGARVLRGDLGKDYDVLVFHTGLPGPRDLANAAEAKDRSPEALAKLQAALPPFEDWSNLADRAVKLTADNALPALKAFVEQGGTLIALGGECDKVVRHWQLPVKVGTFVADPAAESGERATKREEFYIPGSLLALTVDTEHPVAAGTSAEVATMFNAGSPVLDVTGEGATVVASYRKLDTLVSGWAIGEEFIAGKAAVVECKIGKGRILLYGADVTYRGQPLGSAKLFFHGVLTAGDARR